MSVDAFLRDGWTRFEADAPTLAWARAAAGPALAATRAEGAEFRCDGTWFPGINILPNGADGGAPALGVPPLSGAAMAFVRSALGFADIALDRAQVSVCYPGYPRPGPEESPAAARYRRERDAAHVDGLRRVMPGRRRRLGETHGFILGLPLTETEPQAAPLVVWEGSHHLMRRAFRAVLADAPPRLWREIDVTECYHQARREAFETCPRVAVAARPGQSYLIHRLALHGVAPWAAGPDAPPRAVAYFRPEPFADLPPDWWLERP